MTDFLLEPWSEDDLPLIMRLMSDPDVMAHLGGPESPEQIERRNKRYAHLSEDGIDQMFKVVLASTLDPVGKIGYWKKNWRDQLVYEMGWMVLPEYRGQGIGKDLINASLEYLLLKGCRVIGIETMPESAYNIGLYLGRGFKPRYLTIQLSKHLGQGIQAAELPRWSQADGHSRERWLNELQHATLQMPPGFDYTREITCTEQFEVGETLVLTQRGRAAGMCTVALKSPRENAGEDTAIIQVLAIHPAHNGPHL